MKLLFDDLSAECSKNTTLKYSTSFSLGIKMLDKTIHRPIYGIYGFVRFADEIVDSFHDFNKADLLQNFREDTFKAIKDKISLNPILNEFQRVVNTYGVEHSWIDTFLKSMEMDLDEKHHDTMSYSDYILGSAEVVGLMCLHVFVNGDQSEFERLKPYGMSLGSAFQKINFLRDIKADYENLGRTYFPGVDLKKFSTENKRQIEEDIKKDFDHALIGIKQLPASSRKGVYLAYIYYLRLHRKIKHTSVEEIMDTRIRITNTSKIGLLFQSVIKNQLNLL